MIEECAVSIRRVVWAVDCGTVVNSDTVRAQTQGGIIFGITALYGTITLKHGRVEQTNFDSYQIPRMDVVPTTNPHRTKPGVIRRHGRSRDFGYRPCGHQCGFCGHSLRVHQNGVLDVRLAPAPLRKETK
jgi:hypothetical protein